MQTQSTDTPAPNPAAARGSSFLAAGGPMRLAELVYGAWAIMPDSLRELQTIYEAHMRGPKIDVAGIEAKLGRPLANEPAAYEIVDGVAVLPVQGPIAPKMSLMTRISGGTSAQIAARELRAAAADPAVRSILLSIDSPGGSVLGTPEFAAAVRDVADRLPVVTHSDGVMASAAYWIGSAAAQAFISGPTVQVGSIGVVATHQDTSEAEKRAGVTTTEITAGKYKRIASQHGPLTKAGRAAMQDQVDYLYSLFVDAVAAHRGGTPERVLADMADGRIFIGAQAIDAGLVDGMASLDALLESMATDPAKYARRSVMRIKSPPKPAAGARAGESTPSPKGASMHDDDTGAAAQAPLTLEALQRQHAPVYAQALAAGAQQERERISAIRALSLPGHEALIDRMVAEGKSPGDTAMALIAAERAAHDAAANAHAADAPAAVKPSAAPADATQDKEAQAAEAEAYAKANGISFVAALKKLGITT